MSFHLLIENRQNHFISEFGIKFFFLFAKIFPIKKACLVIIFRLKSTLPQKCGFCHRNVDLAI